MGKRPVTPCRVPDRRATEPDESLKPPQLCFSITQCLSLSLSLLVQFLGGFLMDFINSLLSLPSQSEVSWYYCISCAVAHAVIQADDCAKQLSESPLLVSGTLDQAQRAVRMVVMALEQKYGEKQL